MLATHFAESWKDGSMESFSFLETDQGVPEGERSTGSHSEALPFGEIGILV